MRSLIFGANGQDGHYLAESCRKKGILPICVSRSSGDCCGDVADFGFVDSLVTQYSPAYIFHLAARSTTHHDAVFENYATIAEGTVNVLEAARRRCPDARIFIAGSGLQFRNTGAPISAGDSFEPRSAYAAARIASTFMARYYRSLGMKTYIGYLFHHESPFRKPAHVSKQVALAVRRILQREQQVLDIGDLTVAKEWTYAGDVAEAIMTLMGQDTLYEASIGSGIAYTIREWVEACFRCAGLDWQQYVRAKEGFTSEYHVLVSDPSAIRGLGWVPRVGFHELATMMVQQP